MLTPPVVYSGADSLCAVGMHVRIDALDYYILANAVLASTFLINSVGFFGLFAQPGDICRCAEEIYLRGPVIQNDTLKISLARSGGAPAEFQKIAARMLEYLQCK